MSKNDDLEILNCMFKNSKMAADCINAVADKCSNSDLCDYLRKQETRYNSVCSEIENEMRERGSKPANPPTSDTMMAAMGIKMKTMFDGSAENIAKIAYNGTNMGIVDITQTVHRAGGADDKIVQEAQQLLAAEERYANDLKRYL